MESRIGIIARSAFKLTKLTLRKDKLLWGIFAVLAVSTAWTSREIIWLLLVGGVVAVAVKALPTRRPIGTTASLSSLLFPVVTVETNNTLLQLFVYFAKAG
jgi:chromate transporter